MGKMKETLPDFEVRYEVDQPEVDDSVYFWAIEQALKVTPEKIDEGNQTYFRRVETRAVYILSIVSHLKDNINGTNDFGNLD